MQVFPLIVQVTYILVSWKMVVLQNIVLIQRHLIRPTRRQKTRVSDSDKESGHETHTVLESAPLLLQRSG